MTQPPLFPTVPVLTTRQQTALAYISGEGATAQDVGRHWHQQIGCIYCHDNHDCIHVLSAGNSVLRELRAKGLAIRRRSGLWQQTGTNRAPAPGIDPATTAWPEGY